MLAGTKHLLLPMIQLEALFLFTFPSHVVQPLDKRAPSPHLQRPRWDSLIADENPRERYVPLIHDYGSITVNSIFWFISVCESTHNRLPRESSRNHHNIDWQPRFSHLLLRTYTTKYSKAKSHFKFSFTSFVDSTWLCIQILTIIAQW